MESLDNIIHNSPEWSLEEEEQILKPYIHLTQASGKQVRTLLIQAFNNVLRIPIDKLQIISNAIEMLHTASLLIDDIEDDSKLRRGLETSHLIYGVPYTINSSNYIYFKASIELTKLTTDERINFKILHFFNDELLNLHRGQGLDIYWRENLIIPNEESYLKMVMNKCGGLMRLAIKLMELFTDVDTSISLIPLANILGILYQIKDDYSSLKDVNLQLKKGFCEDLTEGKISFPIIHSLHVNYNEELIQILKQHTEDESVKKRALEILESTNTFEYCLQQIRSIKDKCYDIIDELILNKGVEPSQFDSLKKVVEIFSKVDTS